MKELDWSCKENILIKGFDGRLIPMSEPYFESRQIAPGTWQILSSGDYSYLLAGEGQGLLIDSGYGAGNIREYCEKLCGLPVPWIANTHEHFDHTANNCYFDLVFLTEKAHERATTPFKSFQGIDFPKDYPAQYVKTRDVIPLPGRELICFELGDHSPGGVAFLDKKNNILFSGDEIWPTKPLRTSPAEFGRKLEAISEYRDWFDILYAGNGQYGAGVVDKLLICCKRADQGDLGVPAPEDLGLLGFWEDRLPDGTIIYDRIRPHMGDGGAGKKNPNQDRLRCITERGVRLVYLPENI